MFHVNFKNVATNRCVSTLSFLKSIDYFMTLEKETLNLYNQVV